MAKKALPASHVLKGGRRARRHASREADRSSEPLPQQEADAGQAQEEPSRASDATWSGLQGEWTDKVTGKTQSQACENPGRERAQAVRVVRRGAEDAQH